MIPEPPHCFSNKSERTVVVSARLLGPAAGGNILPQEVICFHSHWQQRNQASRHHLWISPWELKIVVNGYCRRPRLCRISIDFWYNATVYWQFRGNGPSLPIWRCHICSTQCLRHRRKNVIKTRDATNYLRDGEYKNFKGIQQTARWFDYSAFFGMYLCRLPNPFHRLFRCIAMNNQGSTLTTLINFFSSYSIHSKK